MVNIGKNAWLRPNGWYIVVSTVCFYVCDYGNHTGFIFLTIYYGQVVELVYTHDSKSCAARRVGSSPTLATLLMIKN